MIQQLIWPWHYECEITRDKQNSSYQTTCCHDTHQATVVQLFFYNTVFILWFITTSNAIDWRKNTAAFDAFVQELSNWVRFCIFAPFFNLRALGAHFKQFLLNTRLQFVRSVAGVHLSSSRISFPWREHISGTCRTSRDGRLLMWYQIILFLIVPRGWNSC